MRISRLLHACALAALLAAAPGGAVIIASGDGTGNVGTPPGDPGGVHVGKFGALSGVYVGNGWVLVARHAAVGDLELDGVVHRSIASSRVVLSGNVDLAMLRIESDPGLPDISIASSAPSGDLLFVGNGRNRGDPIDWDMDPWDDGWEWGPGAELRWGTNVVSETDVPIDTGYQTIAFASDFSESTATAHEAIAAVGDSGGGVFPDDGSGELTGIMLVVATFVGQPPSTALFGNVTYSAQLSEYRNEILSIRAEDACSNGVDDDGDGLVDYPDDVGCQAADDGFERLDALPCDDGFDGDGDGAVDYPEDVGCASPAGNLEDPQCSDGIDNDGDGEIDWDGGAWIHGSPIGPADSHCSGPSGAREKPKSCGLGFELAPLLVGIAALRRRKRRR